MKTSRARFTLAIAVILVLVATSSISGQLVWPGLRAAWADLATWSTPDLDNREVEHGLGLVLEGTGAVKIAFSGKMNRRDPDRPPTSINVQVGMGALTNSNVIRVPTLTLAGDEGTPPRAFSMDFGSRIGVDAPPGSTIENAVVSITPEEFTKLSRAVKLEGNILGFAVTFRADQLRALRALATRLKL